MFLFEIETMLFEVRTIPSESFANAVKTETMLFKVETSCFGDWKSQLQRQSLPPQARMFTI
ncbi:MAG: hypothetical protein KME42_14900 [Tildeniella nuda ZEHNDER 1965/U140]|nr:hypothetical protein [Tildeniella nuda ZEHNDER 1965/U140]